MTKTLIWSLLTLLIAASPRAFAARDDSARSGLEVGGTDELTIGPGRVRFTFEPAGRWTSFVPSWSDGRSLISSGGLVVLADDESGEQVEVASTARGGLRVREAARMLGKYCEGMRGGSRSPMPHPDDDGDGRTDEDRLDGVDNDNDGAIDEDFAAIGDEMAVTEYFLESEGQPLVFHQEAYAWSLPHLDEAVMMSVRLRNAGTRALHNVRFAVFVELEEPTLAAVREVEAAVGLGRGTFRAHAVAASSPGGASVALIGFPRGGGREPRWTGGDAEFLSYLGEQIIDRLEAAGLSGEPRNPIADGTRLESGAVLYLLSRPISVIEPGDEVGVEIALVAAAERSRVDDAAASALRTFAGDGRTQFLPPPVSLKPRVAWGGFRRLADDADAVAVEFDELSQRPVRPEQVRSLTGVDPAAVEKRRTPAGETQLVIHGPVAAAMLDKGETATLKGRLVNGEFFEAILKPRDGAEAQVFATEEAEFFWRTPGKLRGDFLQVSPNPFQDGTSILYEIPAVVEQEDGSELVSSSPLETSIKVYNVAGRLVTVLFEGRISPGSYAVDWTALDDDGGPVASGVYYVKLEIERKYLTKRLILLK